MANSNTAIVPDYLQSARQAYFTVMGKHGKDKPRLYNILSQVLKLSGRDLKLSGQGLISLKSWSLGEESNIMSSTLRSGVSPVESPQCFPEHSRSPSNGSTSDLITGRRSRHMRIFPPAASILERHRREMALVKVNLL
ncbi:hypothetical protein K469DRAFT_690124 [Zopfia rhizophila CBS 207.26]|uniref:Uncharacterized protein n=1 Tax=Zopfia rhizophila CBS 207.26 TaxID=1314779 RepID=A0A6A6DYD3_9PEZI|nr:hypothetical protein K469DRAFT_690124 [Zopfia rhizophila CBS 207.26]